MATPTLEEMKQLGRRDRRGACKVAEAIKNLTAPERTLVLDSVASDDEEVRRGVLIWLGQRNITLSAPAIGNHRTRVCKCNPLR